MKCRLTLLATAWKEPLPAEAKIGFCDHEPVEGRAFKLYTAGPGLFDDPVETGMVRKRTVLQNGQEIEFRTEDSTYKWEFLGFGN